MKLEIDKMGYVIMKQDFKSLNKLGELNEWKRISEGMVLVYIK